MTDNIIGIILRINLIHSIIRINSYLSKILVYITRGDMIHFEQFE